MKPKDYMYIELYNLAKYNNLVWDNFFSCVWLCFGCVLVIIYPPPPSVLVFLLSTTSSRTPSKSWMTPTCKASSTKWPTTLHPWLTTPNNHWKPVPRAIPCPSKYSVPRCPHCHWRASSVRAIVTRAPLSVWRWHGTSLWLHMNIQSTSRGEH